MTHPIDKIIDKYKVPLAHIARATGYSDRQTIRHHQATGPLSKKLEKLYADLYRDWGWIGTNFRAGRYHRNTYPKLRLQLPARTPRIINRMGWRDKPKQGET